MPLTRSYWERILHICLPKGILPPSLSLFCVLCSKPYLTVEVFDGLTFVKRFTKHLKAGMCCYCVVYCTDVCNIYVWRNWYFGQFGQNISILWLELRFNPLFDITIITPSPALKAVLPTTGGWKGHQLIYV